jgi:hypothetical protein
MGPSIVNMLNALTISDRPVIRKLGVALKRLVQDLV